MIYPVPKPIRVKKEKVFREKRSVAPMNPLEEDEQNALCDWLDIYSICYQSSAMGSVSHVVTRMKLKRMGCKPGFPDIQIFDAPPKIPDKKGVCIELKRRIEGVVSDQQKEWQIKLRDRGWISLICAGADSAINALTLLGYGAKNAPAKKFSR